MKYSEYLQLQDVLEKKGTTIQKELGLTSVLNEAIPEKPTTAPAQPDVSTESGHWFTKWGRTKNKLNKAGKAHQQKLIEKVISKYLPTMLKSELETVNLIIKSTEEKKQPDEIANLVKANVARSKNILDKQFSVLNNTMDKYLSNVGKQLEDQIDKSKMKDNNKTDLKNYWILLKGQISMNCLDYMKKTINAKINEILKDNKQAAQIYQQSQKDPNSIFTTINSVFNKDKAEAEKQKKIVQVANQNAKAEEANPATPGAATPDATATVVGKKYNYTSPKGNAFVLTITKDNGDGTYSAESDSGKKDIPITKEALAKLTPVKETPAPDTKPEGEREPKL
jgi:hypothetical protein